MVHKRRRRVVFVLKSFFNILRKEKTYLISNLFSCLKNTPIEPHFKKLSVYNLNPLFLYVRGFDNNALYFTKNLTI